MLKIRCVFILLVMLLSSAASAVAQVSIGINLQAYPEFVVVPGYPVYYAPRLEANLFFYDGMYWIYQEDNWYESTWYNGPWWLVDPDDVPLFILRVPVRYYRMPPAYFFEWRFDAPPRWGEHWGRDWEQHRSGWDRWNHSAVPAPAPLPAYQRQYSGDRYPRQTEQQDIQKRNYRYQPRDPVVRQHDQEQTVQGAPVQRDRSRQETAPEERNYRQQDIRRAAPQQYDRTAPRAQSPENIQFTPPAAPQQVRPEVQERRLPPQQREQPGAQGRNETQQGNKPGQGQDQHRGRDRND